MSRDWMQDIKEMHDHYGFRAWVEKNKDNPEILKTLLKFRLDFLKEELTEAYTALEEGNGEEITDAMIDLCVVAIGTLDMFSVDSEKAWDEVHRANMAKQPGVKPNRPNPLGLPDLIKPEGWVGPNHDGNIGKMPFND